ncbi:MAG: GAF domain-containing SpoIIE family protein phosphatase [Pseudomonadota bacterium]|nr:GAF domain-containing SpoIIE family protein phosphatase [Pseudomonadota bacterium]
MYSVTESATVINAPPASQALALVAELSQALASSLDLEATLHKTVQSIVAAMHAEAASIFLLNESEDALVCRASAGPVDIRGVQLPLGNGVVGRAFSSGRCHMVRDTAHDPDFEVAVDRQTGFCTRSLLCTPLLSGHGVLGVLQVVNKLGGKLFDESDHLLLRALAAPAALAIGNARLAAELIKRDRLRRELTLARRMQRSLLPRRRRGAFPVLALNRPAQEISGDFYDYFDLPDGRIGFTIGDVAGKGLDAAFLMVRCASLMRWAGKEGLPPSAWMARVNEELCESLGNGSFVCAAAGYLDPSSRQLTWANAGFPPLIHLSETGQVSTFRAEGPPLGILAGMTFPQQIVDVGPGAVYLFSDGATDARPPSGVLLGVSGMTDLITKHAGWRPETRLRRIVGELRRMRLHDDTTLMLIGGAWV